MNDNINNKELEQLIERIERGEEEVKEHKDFVKDIYMEAKSRGYDTKMIRKIVKLRAMEKDALAEEDAILEIYRNALNL